MAPNEPRGAPGIRTPRHDQHPATDTDPRSPATVTRGLAQVADLADYRALAAWVAAAEHLNAQGVAAAVPVAVEPALRRRGLIVWPAAPRQVA